MQSKNVIELNGKRYDALSGRYLGEIKTAVATTKTENNAAAVSKTAIAVKVAAKPAAKPQKVHNSIRNVDGVIRARRAPQQSLRPSAPVGRITVRQSAPTKATHATVNHAAAHQPQTAVTLMRTVVKKPVPSFKQQTNVQSALQHTVPSLIKPKTSINSINPRRLERAKTILRSSVIQHHAAEQPLLGIPVSVQEVPVREMPVQAPAPQAHEAAQTPIDIFEHAIKNATHFRDAHAHKQFRKKQRLHLATMTAGGFALLLLVGVIFYQSTPGLQYKMASARAGVSASMPNVAAAGYNLVGVSNEADGKVVVTFTSPSSGARYQLSEQASNWSNDELLNNIATVSANGLPDYGALPDGNVTIYRFGTTSAVWLNNGTLYSLSGNRPISDAKVESLVNHL